NETLGRIHFWGTIVGTFPAFVAMHYLGLGGHLRRLYDPTEYDYALGTQWMNVWISVALFVAVAAQLVFVANLLWSRFRGEPASDNPWEAASIDWSTASPAPHLNWEELPTVHCGPYEYRVNGDDSYHRQTEQAPRVGAEAT
ncbi:MAG: cytochrome c oxidase subunit I, partial [Gemmatimonadales bacterium]